MTGPSQSPPGPGQDFAEWTAENWKEIAPATDSTTAAVGIRFSRLNGALEQSHARVVRHYKHHGIATVDDFRVLGMLRLVGISGIRSQHIADHLQADPGTMSGRLNRLEKHNLIERFADPNDGRAKLVRLREQHEPLIDEIYQALVLNHERFFAKLTAEEHRTLAALLAKL